MSSTAPVVEAQPKAQLQAQLVAILRNPLTWTVASAAAFVATFGAVIQTSNSLTVDPSMLRVWWVGTVLSSFVFLLLFFLVFRSSEHFNTALLTLLFIMFVITHVSLLLTQINLRV